MLVSSTLMLRVFAGRPQRSINWLHFAFWSTSTGLRLTAQTSAQAMFFCKTSKASETGFRIVVFDVQMRSFAISE